eukprot:gnl/TRDRNA2_/TRDRNA2_176854_c5_seq1.p1 gnl/TRDRNA2_/TRDRNA2_176854_c5~~gnl/TRDRNA2_/TRDRNA2_176854_c5_seq1.p1  ORF type:complete len:1099 (+),score=270.37 gnl/TRDRNA2_/TRDRNA2_176854_c5_seq1:163-3297(+)
MAEFGEFENCEGPKGVTELAEASYGVFGDDSAAIDVKSCIEADFLSGKKIVVKNDTMGGDPKPGVRKVLRLKYKHVEKPSTITVDENQSLAPPPYAEAILEASYGSGNSRVSVKHRIQKSFLMRESFNVTNGAMGCDPDPGVTKDIQVTYLERQRLAFKFQTAGELATFESIAPWLFNKLREAIGITNEAFFGSLAAELSGGSKETSGKSGEIFWFTGDKAFTLKTIQEAEVATLVGMLPTYREYLVSNPDSLLTRYLGIFRLTNNGEVIQFVVMNNVFDGSTDLDVMYDLKGTTEDRWVDPEGAKCLKDNNWAGAALYCEDEIADGIVSMIDKDTKFLESEFIMDYSLMLGISYDASDWSEDAAARRYSKYMGGLVGNESKSVLGDKTQKCVFFIGIIDMLITYGWKKEVAHAVKSATLSLIKGDVIDTVPPDEYGIRYRMTFRKKILGKSEEVGITKVESTGFELPMPAMGRSGGTAAFFRSRFSEGAEATHNEAALSKEYWIGKDLSRAVDEVSFYEASKKLEGQEEWDLLKWMTAYKGICRCPCEVEEGEPPQDTDVMLIRNGRDGYKTCRMLDIKIGEVTAVAGWQGKSAMSAYGQSYIDALTNSSTQGFRLEGFDSPPEVLHSLETMVTEGYMGMPNMGKLLANEKKLKRFLIQRLSAVEFLPMFLDLHDVSGSSYAKKSGLEASSNAVEDPSCLSRVEMQELVLLNCIEELASFVEACRRVPVPQQWIGSSVMLCFDSGELPPREVLSRGSKAWGVARVHVFDWGRSELNMPRLHERLLPEDQAERTKYWGYYCAGIGKLLYDCCDIYFRRFVNPKRCLTFTMMDQDRFQEDDFIGFCTVPFAEMSHAKQTLLNKSGEPVKSRMFFGSDAQLGVTLSEKALPEDSRLKECWRVKVHSGENVPRMDNTSPTDGKVEVLAFEEDTGEIERKFPVENPQVDDRRITAVLTETAHQTTVAKDEASPIWEEEFEIATLRGEAEREPFLRAVSVACGKPDQSDAEAMEAAKSFFPHRWSQLVKCQRSQLQDRFVAACFPSLAT